MGKEYVTASKATEMLGISSWKMAELIKDGTLRWYPDPFNKRRKLILKTDVEALKAQRPNVFRDEEKEVGERAAPVLAY